MARLTSVNSEVALGLAVGKGDSHQAWRIEDGSLWGKPYVLNAYPLLVLDPADREQMLAYGQAYCDATASVAQIPDLITDRLVRAARLVLESPAPPKPDEPTGLGAVVVNATGMHWTRTGAAPDGEWALIDGAVDSWADVDAVRILSPGITPDEPEAEEALPPDLTLPNCAFSWRDGAYYSLKSGMTEEPWTREQIRSQFTGTLTELPHDTAVTP